MPEKTKEARHGGNHARAKRPERDANIIAQNYGRGSLLGGLLIAVAFGSMLVHAAVM